MKFLLSLACLLLALPVHAVNLLQNSGFELGTAYWGIAEGGNMDYPLHPEIFLTNAVAHSGNYSFAHRQQSSGGNCFGTFPIRLKAGQAYCFSMWANGISGSASKVYILNCRDHRTVPNANFGGVDGPSMFPTLSASGVWQRYYTNWVTPTTSNTAYFIRFEPGFNGATTFYDDLQLEEVANVFSPPTTYAPCADVETAIVFPASRGANRFWTNETVSVPIITFNWSANTLDVTNVWAVDNYRFDRIQSNSFSATIGSGVKVTNVLDLTPTTNIVGTYRVTTWCKGYEAPTIAENTFGVIRQPVVIPYPSTNSHFGSMIPFERYWLTNAYDAGFKWIRTLSVGRTNSIIAGQFLRWPIVTVGYPEWFGSGVSRTYQLTNADGSANWRTNAGNQAGMALATNSGFTILGVIEWLRTTMHGDEWGIQPQGVGDSYTNGLLWPTNYYNYARAVAAAYSPYIKYWELGNEFDTEGGMDYELNGKLNAINWSGMIISNAWNAIKSNFPSLILIPYNAFQPANFSYISNYLGPNFFTDKILSSHVYGGGEFGAGRLYTNTSVAFQQAFGLREHWQTESGTTCKSERQNFPFEEIMQGEIGAAGTHATEGSDPVQRSAEVIRNYVVWSRYPTHDKWFYHLIDEKRSVLDPQSHSIFDWDGAITMRACSISALAQIFEGSFGVGELRSNAVPINSGGPISMGADGGCFARGTTNCPIVVFWGTNDIYCYRAHINLATNLWNVRDMYGNQQARDTNIVFSSQPVIIEGQAGTLSNTLWNAVLITATNADPIAPKVVFTKHPTRVAFSNETFTWKWAARDNLVAQFSQGGTDGQQFTQRSAVTNLLKHRYLLAGYDAGFSAFKSNPTNDIYPNAFQARYTNVPPGTYTMHVQVMDTAGNIGSNSFNWTVAGVPAPPVIPPVPAGPAGSRLRIGVAP